MQQHQLQIRVSKAYLIVQQQTDQGTFVKQFSSSWAGIAALSNWLCDIVRCDSRIDILTDQAGLLPAAANLVSHLQSLSCDSGVSCNFTIRYQ